MNKISKERRFRCSFFRLLPLFVASVSLTQAQTGFQLAPGNFNAGDGPYGAVSADFNHEGIADLAFVDFASSSVIVLLGNGRGGFRPSPSPTFRSRASQSFSILSADFNNDGNPDNGAGVTFARPLLHLRI